MEAPLGLYNLEVVWSAPMVGEWKINCYRCGFEAQTAKDSQYTESWHLHDAIKAHVCDPAKKVKTSP